MYGWAAILACFVLLGASVSLNGPERCRLLDGAGIPLRRAFVIYHYAAGTRLIWPWAHADGPFLIRTDPEGRFSIPWRAHLRFPFTNLTSPVRVYAGVYVPPLHNSCELLGPSGEEPACATSATRSGERVFQLFDLSTRPAARFRTLWRLIYGGQALRHGPATDRKELIRFVRREYNQFLETYGDAVFANSPDEPGHIPVSDWTGESGEHRPWRFFLQQVPFYSIPMDKKLAQMEAQAG